MRATILLITLSKALVLRTKASPGIAPRITLALFAITSLLLSGCSLFKPAAIDSHLTVLNRSSQNIKLIQRQNCLDTNDIIETLVKDLRSGQMKKIDAVNPGDCVNLFAYDYDDAVIARQKNISFPPGFTWIIH